MSEATIYDLTHPGWRDEEIARLRTALERTRPHVRNEIVEECAQVVKSFKAVNGNVMKRDLVAAIRALKDKP